MIPLPWTVPGRQRGADVSSAQHPSRALMASLAAGGCISVDVKGSDWSPSRQVGYTDQAMTAHLAFARELGLSTGIYGFFHSDQPWQPQAEAFLRAHDAASAVMPLTMRPTIDWEDQARIRTDPARALGGVVGWCEFVRARTGRRPTCYTGKPQVDILTAAKVDASPLLAYDLWDAHYRWDPLTGHDYGVIAPTPIVIGGVLWPCVAWQCGGNGAPRFAPVDGWVPVDIDLDVYYIATTADFLAWCADKPTVEPGLNLGPSGSHSIADEVHELAADAEARSLMAALDDPDPGPNTKRSP